MKKHLLFAFLGALACCSCSNSYDLLENDAELARAAEDYELSTRAASAEADSAKIETIADEQAIQATMDEYEQKLMNRLFMISWKKGKVPCGVCLLLKKGLCVQLMPQQLT